MELCLEGLGVPRQAWEQVPAWVGATPGQVPMGYAVASVGGGWTPPFMF
ncbi:hypothetical protein [Pontibacter sp. G13]|nr:hypothetical protein [Pontibacter sp. G13]WNJ20514.1 hypothetical protein RJD25_08530 [Pontibacter sp. G13]